MRSERKKQIYLHFSEPQGRKACAAGLKRKTENFEFFGFRLEWENGTPRLSREQRLLADYAETKR